MTLRLEAQDEDVALDAASRLDGPAGCAGRPRARRERRGRWQRLVLLLHAAARCGGEVTVGGETLAVTGAGVAGPRVEHRARSSRERSVGIGLRCTLSDGGESDVLPASNCSRWAASPFSGGTLVDRCRMVHERDSPRAPWRRCRPSTGRARALRRSRYPFRGGCLFLAQRSRSRSALI